MAVVAIMGCNSGGSRGAADAGEDAGSDRTASAPDAGGAGDSGADAAARDAGRDARIPRDAAADATSGNGGLTYDEEGCLTFEGASRFCGSESDGEICAFSTECGTSSDEGQCLINCEMGTTVQCTMRGDVKCVEEAFERDSCDALDECGFIL